MRLFYEQGYANTGIATILRDAGVNSGSLYHFFASKEALLIAVLQQYTHMLRPVVLAPIEAKTSDPVQRVFELLAWYRDGMLQTGCRMGCPIGNLALEVSDHAPDARSLVQANFEGWVQGVAGWLAEAKLPPDVDRKELAQMVLNTMEGGIMQARAHNDIAPFDAAVRQLRKYFDYLQRDARGAWRDSENSQREGAAAS